MTTQAESTGQPIAIVGMACRYPDATNVQQLWQNVLAQRVAFRRIPSQRLPSEYLGDANNRDLTYVTHAGLLRGWEFDRERFGVPGPLYRAADITHWLALGTAAEALVDAGFPDADGLDRDHIGVIIGNSLTGEFSRAAMMRTRWPFLAAKASVALKAAGVPPSQSAEVLGLLEAEIKRPFPEPGDESLAGALSNTIAGRICNYFDFHGAGYTVDGACSSSLLAVITACRALRTGELSFAIAGGVDLSLDPLELVGFARLGALAVDDMRIYDAQPTGFLPGEGCGLLALMRASDAHEKGVRVYAYLTGWGTSADGAGGLTRPEVAGQAMALERAYRMAALDPCRVGLVEGHGTGTAVGDAVELEALTRVRQNGSPRAVLGSIKANIGHTKAAAGAAGLIKATLAIHHQVLPPTTGCREPHTFLNGDRTTLRLTDVAEPWPDRETIAGVSSMGFGGINTHVVVSGTPRRPPRELPLYARRWSAPPRYATVTLDAQTPKELRSKLAALARHAELASQAELYDLAATAFSSADMSAPCRAALIAARPEQLSAGAEHAAANVPDRMAQVLIDQKRGYCLGSGPAARVGLLFPGQAAPVRSSLASWASGLVVPEVPAGFRIRSGDSDTANAQPAITRQSLAGLAWLDAIGCQAATAVGHSLGEISALVWAGWLTPNEGLRLAAIRGQLMALHGGTGTTMAGLGCSAETARLLLGNGPVSIACYNAPAQTTIAGPINDVDTVVCAARAQGIDAAVLQVSHGFHSAAMSPVKGPLHAALERFPLVMNSSAPSGDYGEFVSTVTGRPLEPNQDPADLLVEQLTEPVRFAEAMSFIEDRCDLLVEVGPGTSLSGLARSCLPHKPTISLDCGGDARQHIMATACLAAACAADLTICFAERGYRHLSTDALPVFLTSPCEAVPVPAGSVNHSATRFDAAELPSHATTSSGGTSILPNAGELVSADPTDQSERSPEDVLRDYLTKALELPRSAIRADSSLLMDLHLNSLQVAEAIAVVARQLGRQPQPMQLTASDTTVSDAVSIVLGFPLQDANPAAAFLGVRDWVRPFSHQWIPLVDRAPADLPAIQWTVRAAETHWLKATLECTNSAEAEPSKVSDPETTGLRPVRESGLAIVLDGNTGLGDVASILRDASLLNPRWVLVLHDCHPAAPGIGRSLAVELANCSVTIVNRSEDGHPFDPRQLLRRGYQEIRCDSDNQIWTPTTRLHRTINRGAPVVGDNDVCLLTGGANGITACCAEALAKSSGCRLVVLGRSAASSGAVIEGMQRMPKGSVYIQCDITQPTAIAGAIATASEIGTIRALMHGAGINNPQRLGSVTSETLQETLAPKVEGLRLLLEALGEHLRLVLAFGSIIGRLGLPGQSEYCIANDWMRHDLERWADRHPDCRSHLIEWSLWSGVGMGDRLGTVERLKGLGITPIRPELGAAALLELVADEDAPRCVLISARFPPASTLSLEDSPPGPLRFTETSITRTPGVEVVTESRLDATSDPYVDDHRIGPMAVVPATMGLEAIAQGAATIVGHQRGWSFTDIRLNQPVTIDRNGHRTIRVAGVTRYTDSPATYVDLLVRDDADGFTTDKFTATLVPETPVQPLASLAPMVAPDTARGCHPWYGPLMFHTGRFTRLVEYELVSAYAVRAWIDADPTHAWFSDFHSQELLLGDPGTHDATLHVLMACAPNSRILPVGADRFTVLRKPTGRLFVNARERSHTIDDFVFDVDLREPDGTVVAAWRGLNLHVIGDLDWSEPLPARLVGPSISRRLIRAGIDGIDILTGLGSRKNAPAAKLVGRVSGRAVKHDAHGAMKVAGSCASASYTENHVMVAIDKHPIGIDWEPIRTDTTRPWGDMLDAKGRDLAAAIADKTGEKLESAYTYAWVTGEAIFKLDRTIAESVQLTAVEQDGLIIGRAGPIDLAIMRIQSDITKGPIAVAIATLRSQ